MLLAIDAGNSNIVLGCIDGAEIPRVIRMSSDISKTEDEYAAGIKSLLEFYGISPACLSGAVLSCVVPPLTGVLSGAVKLLCGLDAVIVGAGIKTGMNILIDDPGQLGSDMVASAVGALSLYKPPIIIADMGTATKLTVINKNKSFIGGAILPGVRLSMDALSAGTSQLPKVPVEPPPKCICANTIDCMKSGAIFGAASMLDGMTERFETELGEPAAILATGGLAELVTRHCKRDIICDPLLVLRGLSAIYDKNRKPAARNQAAIVDLV